MNLTKKRITRKNIFENNIAHQSSLIETINLNSKLYEVVKQVEIDNYYLLDLNFTTTSCRCKTCGNKSNKIHSKKAVYPLIGVFNNKGIIMRIMKNRFKCNICNKVSLEPTFGVKYKNQIANCIKGNVINYLFKRFTYIDSARLSFISPSTVIKIFDNYNVIYKRYTKIENILIDELRLISNKKKFQFVVIDADSKEIIDILETRNQKDVTEYLLNNFSIGNLKTVTMDLWNPYKNAVTKFNKVTNRNVQIIADKFHFIRQLMWDLDDFRIEEYEKVKEAHGTDDNDYKVIKHISKILRMRRVKLTIKGQSRLNEAFGISDRLYVAYQFKESYLNMIQTVKSKEEFKKELNDWFSILEKANIDGFKRTITSHKNWIDEISNAFKYEYSNGYIEGANQKMKLAKNKAFGFSNFERTAKLMQITIGKRKVI